MSDMGVCAWRSEVENRRRLDGDEGGESQGKKKKNVFFGRRVGSCKSLKAFNADPRVGGGQRSGIFMKAPFLARKG